MNDGPGIPFLLIRRARGAALAGLLIAFLFGCRTDPSPLSRPFTMGVLSDIQYADKDPGGLRHYRSSLQRLEECVADLNARKPDIVIQLGDIIDSGPESHLDAVLESFDRLTMPLYHVVGNHCLTIGREPLRRQLALQSFYYDFILPGAKGWRFVVLDGNDGGYGVVGWPQQEWFRATLKQAVQKGERVICFCHFPLIDGAAPGARMADPQPLLSAMDEAPCVVAWFAGHDHAGGYAIRKGVHHVTIKGMVEASQKNAYALIELYPDGIRERGIGEEPCREMKWPVSPASALPNPSAAVQGPPIP